MNSSDGKKDDNGDYERDEEESDEEYNSDESFDNASTVSIERQLPLITEWDRVDLNFGMTPLQITMRDSVDFESYRGRQHSRSTFYIDPNATKMITSFKKGLQFYRKSHNNNNNNNNHHLSWHLVKISKHVKLGGLGRFTPLGTMKG